jgi:hypothetical protein
MTTTRLFLALQWLRKHDNVQDEISEMQDEQNRQQQSVYIFFSMIFSAKIHYLGWNN